MNLFKSVPEIIMGRVSEKTRGKSLRTEVMLALTVVLVFTCVFVMLVDYYMVYTSNSGVLRRDAEERMNVAAETLVRPLWLYDTAFIGHYAEILSDNPNLLRVVIFDERDRVLVDVKNSRQEHKKIDLRWTLERDVFSGEKQIGRIKATFTNSEIGRLTRQMLHSDLMIMFTVLISVLGTAWALLTRQILAPLEIMKNSFQRISAGDYSSRVSLEKENELSLIAREFNFMVDQVELREKKIRESEVKYRNLVESSTDIIFRTSMSGHLVFLNKNFEKWTGFGMEDFLGQPYSYLFPSKSQGVDFSEKSGNDARYRMGLASKSVYLHEVEFQKKDGGKIPMELNLTMQMGVNGQPEGVMGIARDITKRKKSDAELRKYEQMIASSADLMWLVDSDFNILAANDALLRTLGSDRRDITGRSMGEVLGQDRFQSIYCSRIQECLTGINVSQRVWIGNSPGGRRYMDITYHPNVESDQMVSGVVIVERDMTEQKNLEDRLRQTQKMEAIGTLAGGIAHDFNNILGGIIGYGEMIEMFDAVSNERLRSRIGHILSGASRARDLVEQILTFSRQGEQEKSPLCLAPIVKESLKLLRATIPSTITIQENFGPGKGVVLADATPIHQVIMNLCTNAAHAMREEGGVLTVSLGDVDKGEASCREPDMQGQGYVRLMVSDTGHGIDPDLTERIFEPFFTTKDTGENTGMGLAVVHGIVKNFGGYVSVDSQEGEGTTFSVMLPRCSEDGVQGARECKTVASSGKGRILFIDDEKHLVGFSREILEHLGYEVTGETCSKKAKKLFNDNPYAFDLVITDQTMPHHTGLELAGVFLKKRPDLPVVLCTGYSNGTLESDARAAGVKAFIRKPMGARQLADLVSELMPGNFSRRRSLL